MFSVSFPDNCRKERCWISAVLLREFLGIEHEVRFDAKESAYIHAEGKTLELSDVFFKTASDNWMGPETSPAEPLQQWLVSESKLFPELIAPSIPVIFGHAGFEIKDNQASLGLDIFGSAFFMLSRYEEAVSKQRDNHDRFPATASLAFREGFLERPIIDEYVEILWSAMQRLWPQARRRQHEYKALISCDVDRPYHPGATSFRAMARATVGNIIRTRGLTGMLGPAQNYLSGRCGDFRHDPYYFTVDWMMDANEKAGNVLTFNFIPETTNLTYDGRCSLTDPAIVDMLKRIDLRQHEIGIHPGYHCYLSQERTLSGLNKLRNALSQAGIAQQVAGGRNHYLRWSTRTPAIWNAAGLRYDSTLGYSDHVGFRCGTCREYPMFDLHQREALELRQQPLLCMDRTIIMFMGYGFTHAALDRMNTLKNAAKKMKGNFSLLWHNSVLESKSARDIYCEAIHHAL